MFKEEVETKLVGSRLYIDCFLYSKLWIDGVSKEEAHKILTEHAAELRRTSDNFLKEADKYLQE